MRVFELSTRVKAVGRSGGRSATAAAAYRACCVIACEREGKTHDYSRKRELEIAEIVLPAGAAAWAKERVRLWNAAEQREQNKDKRAKSKDKANAQVAREFFFSFPAELSVAGRLTVARTIARHLANTHGIAADFAIHAPGKEGDERNYHCHMLTTTRRLTAKGLGEKAREWDDLKQGPKLAKELRAFIAATLNAELKAEGKDGEARVEHRSFKDRGSSQKPQIHHGPGKTHALRKSQGQARRAWFQKVQKEQRERHAKELASLKTRQDFGLQAKLSGLDRRGQDGAKAIQDELAAQRRADTAPDGLRGAFLTATGRAMRDAFGRQERDAQRSAAAAEKLDALQTELRVQRSAYSTGQAQERAALIERHSGEDRQLREALASRESLDRSAEVIARRQEAEERSQMRDQQQEQGRGGGRSIGEDLTPP